MENGLEGHEARLAQFRGQVVQGLDWVAEALEKLKFTEIKLKQAELDLQYERTTRRQLQELNDKLQERQAKRPYAVALIDADGYVFRDKFITKGERGGEEAADELQSVLQDYVQPLVPSSNGVDIIVKAFANVGGLGTALKRDGRIKDASQLKAFLTGFNKRKGLFDFVDVGSGKERADFKIRESMSASPYWAGRIQYPSVARIPNFRGPINDAWMDSAPNSSY